MNHIVKERIDGMVQKNISTSLRFLAVFLSFGIAFVSFNGIILHDDFTGRMIFGITWTLIGFLWLKNLIPARKE